MWTLNVDRLSESAVDRVTCAVMRTWSQRQAGLAGPSVGTSLSTDFPSVSLPLSLSDIDPSHSLPPCHPLHITHYFNHTWLLDGKLPLRNSYLSTPQTNIYSVL